MNLCVLRSVRGLENAWRKHRKPAILLYMLVLDAVANFISQGGKLFIYFIK